MTHLDDNKEKAKNKDGSCRKINWVSGYFSEHPFAILCLFSAGIFLPAATEFMTKQMKVWWIGFGILAVVAMIIVFICKSITTAMDANEHQGQTIPTSRPLTLREIFDKDFPSGGIASEVSFTSSVDGSESKLPFQFVTDFSSKSVFLAFYIPDTAHRRRALQSGRVCVPRRYRLGA